MVRDMVTLSTDISEDIDDSFFILICKVQDQQISFFYTLANQHQLNHFLSKRMWLLGGGKGKKVFVKKKKKYKAVKMKCREREEGRGEVEKQAWHKWGEKSESCRR